ncbi:MAG: polyphosphate kinase 1 [Thermomicrobiales bacterium]|nr:polyphosphate kinase 1 [Thermomicrobiales bacterium]
MPKATNKRSRRRRAENERDLDDDFRQVQGPGANGAPPAGDLAAGVPVSPEPFDLPPLLPELFINRELSWLDFNDRVLFEAEEEANPLLERVKFAAIFASNLDEFFMIRVAGIKRKIAAGIAIAGPDGRTPTQLLRAVRSRTQQALDHHARLVTKTILPELAERGIDVVPYDALSPQQQEALTRQFAEEIFPILTPQAIDRGRRFPHVSNGSLNLIAELRLREGSRYARVKIPATLPRLVRVAAPDDAAGDERATFTWLEQVVAANLPRLFAGATIVASYPFHVTRDSDIELDEEDDDDQGDLMMTMRESIAQRAFGPVVRLMTDRTMPEDVRRWLVEQLHASEQDLYVVDGPLACEDLIELASLDRPELKYPPFIPAPVPGLTTVPGQLPEDLFALIRERDILVHHPYQSFGAVVDFLRAAATDPNVVAIKQTLYRLGRDSPLIPALIEARDDDTQVAVLVELKARFDEENNITWAEQLERHGVHVAYGLAGLKTHCKATLVVRREAAGLRRYVHLATGNYNATTARLYEDFGYLTAREDIGADVSDLFNVLTGFAQQEEYRSIWVAPGNLRERLLAAIDREIEAHQRSGGGHLVMKLNSLVDRLSIRALYKASRAGVRIDLIVRGACCLRPGVPGWSENIRVISIVGRFLEHSRVYAFGSGGEHEVYLGSADLMERNLDRRVEVVFPVEDRNWARAIRDEILPAYFRDTANGWELGSDGVYRRLTPPPGESPFDAQAWLLNRYRVPADWSVSDPRTRAMPPSPLPSPEATRL